jgi:hypothetical protein
MSKIDHVRGSPRAAQKRSARNATAREPETRAHDGDEAMAPPCANAGRSHWEQGNGDANQSHGAVADCFASLAMTPHQAREAAPARKKRLINLERRAHFQRLGGSLR